jgi:carboxyl-terminal processing protease
VNRFSASASEIVAACLQDHQRATVIGERTWGKGTVQSLFFMEGGRSALKLTIANYSRPSGANIHRWDEAGEEEEWGVRPNDGFAVPLEEAQLVALAQFRSRRDLSLDPLPPTSPTPAIPSPTEDEISSVEPSSDTQAEGDTEAEGDTGDTGDTQDAEADSDMQDAPAEEDEQVSQEAVEETLEEDTTDDVEVESWEDLDPSDWIGRDPQLRRAVEYLRGGR